MSIICGIFAEQTGREIPKAWSKYFRRNVTRSGIGRVREYEREGVHILKLDIGAFHSPAWKESAGGTLVAIAGDTIFRSRGTEGSREQDAQNLIKCDERNLPVLLRQSRGNFNVLKYEPEGRRLLLATDRVGVRPLYWCRHDGFLIFSTAKRLIYHLPGKPSSIDLRGFAESLAFNFPLANRTEISDVESLAGGKVIIAHDGTIELETYWDWSRDVEPAMPETPELRKLLYHEFKRSVEMRKGTSPAVFAALSGGLDSRCVVAALTDLGAQVNSLNVSWPDSLDQILARKFAKEIGSYHIEGDLGYDDDGRAVIEKCFGLMKENGKDIEKKGGPPRQIWGGNDGSISVGYVYVSEESVATLRDDRIDDATRIFLREKHIEISPTVFKPSLRDWIVEVPFEGVRDELIRMNCHDPGQKLYFFLLLNFQRRMMNYLLEDIDVYPYEPIEPFFDTDFIALACRLPTDQCLNHGLFNRWLTEFNPVVSQVPWQAYPGHEGCPIPLPDDLSSQWEIGVKLVKPAKVSKTLADFDEIPWSGISGGDFIDWRKTKLMRIGQRFGIKRGTESVTQAVKAARILEQLSL